VDGSPLPQQDIAGYRIYLGTVPGQYSEQIRINDPNTTKYVVRDLAPGTQYYISMTTLDTAGQESPKSAEMQQKAVPLAAIEQPYANKPKDRG
jgi:hypothetical protein